MLRGDSVAETPPPIPPFKLPFVIKASWPCAGKGVFVCHTEEDVRDAFDRLEVLAKADADG
jgi:biotin carboxylase